MSLIVTSLASGSSGNALLAQCGPEALLIDSGIALRTLERLLGYRGIAMTQIRAVLLTHEHGDHALSAAALARRYGIPVVCNAATRAALGDELKQAPVEELPVGERASIGAFDVTSFSLRHDAAEPVGFRVTAAGATAALAVDLGSWDEGTVQALRNADLVVLEANHDRELLRAAPYPWAIQQRIFGPLGHLDNVQAGELLARAVAQQPCDVWLAHLSAQANSPQMAVKGVRRVLDLAGVADIRLKALPRRSVNAPGGAPTWHSDSRLMQGRLF
jgi:phosphoribosyl 1,2-cyclic phosphodiesterase